MKIKLKRTRLYTNLIFGLIWMILGMTILLTKDTYQWTDFGYVVVAVLYIGHFLYDLRNQYLIVENGTIRKNGLYEFRKKINLNDIHTIKLFAGVYTLKSIKKELKIDTTFIDIDSLGELNKLLKELNLEPGKTPWSK